MCRRLLWKIVGKVVHFCSPTISRPIAIRVDLERGFNRSSYSSSVVRTTGDPSVGRAYHRMRSVRNSPPTL